MSGDPKVLAGLQQAYLAATSAKVLQRIQIVWDFEVNGKIVNNDDDADAEIRAWTPPPAEPSLEQRVAQLEGALKTLNDSVQSLDRDLNAVGEIVDEHDVKVRDLWTPPQHPEPTAPDDPVCATCGHGKSKHDDHRYSGVCTQTLTDDEDYCPCFAFLPAPQPAPDLDPVRVEVTQENVAKALEIVGRAFHHPDTFFQYEDDRASFQFAVWVLDRIGAKFSYLKDGGA